MLLSVPVPGPPGHKRPSGNLNQRYDLQEKPEAVLSPLGIRADMLETASAPSGVRGNILETVPAQCPVVHSPLGIRAVMLESASGPPSVRGDMPETAPSQAIPASERTCWKLHGPPSVQTGRWTS